MDEYICLSAHFPVSCLSDRPDDEAVVLVWKLPLGVPDVAAHDLTMAMTQGTAAGVPQKHRSNGKILTRSRIQWLTIFYVNILT